MLNTKRPGEHNKFLNKIKALVRVFLGTRPLSHPTKALHGKYILELARDTHHSVALTRIVQNLPITCWSIFLSILNVVKDFDVIFTDVAALFGYEPSGQMVVVEKIESFINKISQRAIANMVRMHRESNLVDT